MQFIEPSFNVLDIPDANDHDEVLRFLEKIGRTCYKSEDKITDGSAVRYLNMIRDRKHWAMLEHFIFVMEVSPELYYDLMNERDAVYDDYEFHEKIKYINMSSSVIDDINRYFISGSITAFNYIHECKRFHDATLHEKYYNKDAFGYAFEKVFSFLKDIYPEIASTVPVESYIYHETNEYDIRLLKRVEIESLPDEVRLIHDFMTVRYVVDRGVTHELVRHRPCSWAQESTRYCNYGKKGMTFILPLWIPDIDKSTLLDSEKLNKLYNDYLEHGDIDGDIYNANTIAYLTSIFESTESYNYLISDNEWTPQQARSILPNSIKAEIVQTARLSEWKHFFDMRADKPAHPQMREVVCPLLKYVGDKYHIFEEQAKKYLED